MRTKCICFVLLFHAVLLGAGQWRNDYKLYEEHSAWLKFHAIPMTWGEARITCRYEGSDLASPTPRVIDTMTNIITSNDVPSGKLFTGIHATFASRHFSTVEGVPISKIPHKWAKGEPNNLKNPEDCIALTQQGTLVDLRCEETLPFICYKKNQSASLNACGSHDDEYVLDTRTGSCYKFHQFPHTWSRAYMICEAEGGHLAVINSEVEVEVIKDIFTRYPEKSLLPHEYTAGAYVGFRDVNEHTDWLTVQGQSLKEAGFDKFLQGQPDNFKTGQNCGYFSRSGLLDDIECHIRQFFICEKDPHYLKDL